MESRVKVAGHPLHQMLLVFPLGLLATAVVFDVIFLVTDNPTWTQAAFYMIGAGVITGLMAAVPGALDWWAIPRGTRAKRVGLIHGVGNVVVVVLFAFSWLLRRDNPTLPPTEAVHQLAAEPAGHDRNAGPEQPRHDRLGRRQGGIVAT